ncbi:MAG TPA: hypothetical protein VK615_10805 [Candidatus Binatia bacterium]|nr:hypothetical protein [Candidatus Binatia bacterium]
MKASRVQMGKTAPATVAQCLLNGDTRLMIKRRKSIIQRRPASVLMGAPPAGLFRAIYS